MAIVYILGTLTFIFFNIKKIPATVALILTSAFSPVAAVGGFAGASVRMAIQNGVARGVFSNESGLGSAPIAAAAAKTNEPVEQLPALPLRCLYGLSRVPSIYSHGRSKDFPLLYKLHSVLYLIFTYFTRKSSSCKLFSESFIDIFKHTRSNP